MYVCKCVCPPLRIQESRSFAFGVGRGAGPCGRAGAVYPFSGWLVGKRRGSNLFHHMSLVAAWRVAWALPRRLIISYLGLARVLLHIPTQNSSRSIPSQDPPHTNIPPPCPPAATGAAGAALSLAMIPPASPQSPCPVPGGFGRPGQDCTRGGRGRSWRVQRAVGPHRGTVGGPPCGGYASLGSVVNPRDVCCAFMCLCLVVCLLFYRECFCL